MLSIPQYLIESSFCLIIFYGFYHLLLRKETFFQLNRLYLLATPILSLLIPLLNISFRKEEVAATAFDTVIYPAIQSAQQVQAIFWEQMREPTPVFALSVSDVLMGIYMGGVFLMAFTLLKSLWRLNRLIRKGKREKQDGFTKVELAENFPAASFFGYIFWNQSITDEQKLILEHEKVHIRQWHSLDVLAMELIVIVKWFNPLIYFFRNALKATHEFIADQFVIQQKTNLKTYAQVLVNTTTIQNTPLTNTFYSMTKKRLQMMLQQPSQKWKQAKYFLVLPIILVLMSLFSFNLIEEFQPIKEGLADMDSMLTDIGNTTVFEIDLPTEKEENSLLADAFNTSLTPEELQATTNGGLTYFGPADNERHLQWGDLRFAIYEDSGPMSNVSYLLHPAYFYKNVNKLMASALTQEVISFDKATIAFYLSKDVTYEDQSELLDKANYKKVVNSTEYFMLTKGDIEALQNKIPAIEMMVVQFEMGGVLSTCIINIEGMANTASLNHSGRQAIDKDATYSIKWGAIEMHLMQPFSDENKILPILEITREELITAFGQPVEILKNGQLAKDVELIELQFNSTAQNPNKLHVGRTFLTQQIQENGIPIGNLDNIETVEKVTHDGAIVNISVNQMELLGLLRVKTETQYFSPYQVTTKPLEVFKYQVIVPEEGKTILKIDTTLASNQKIVAMYRNPSKFQLIHIPNFQTSNRLIMEKKDRKAGPLRSGPPMDRLDLMEYIDFEPVDLKLSLGTIEANPKSLYHSLTDFVKNQRQALQLFHKDEELVIKRFHLATHNHQRGWQNIVVDDWSSKEVVSFLKETSTQTSFYFDKLIVEKDGKEYYLPQTFLISIGKGIVATLPNTSSGYVTPNASPKTALAAFTPTNTNKDQYQIRWGKYAFNCKVTMQSSRRYCECEKKFIAEADLKSMNRSGIKFYKNNQKVDFRNVRVNTKEGQVYCAKEDLMMYADQQEQYNKKACIWNAFKETDKGDVSFQTEEFARVNFGFSVTSNLANDLIPPKEIVLGKERFDIGKYGPTISYRQAKQLIEQDAYIQYYEQALKIDRVKISRAEIFEDIALVHTTYYLDKQEDRASLDAKIAADHQFYIHSQFSKDSTTLLLFSFKDPEVLKLRGNDNFTWGPHEFNYGNTHLALSRNTVKDLLEKQLIRTPSGVAISTVEEVQFIYKYRPNVTCSYKGDWEGLKKDPVFRKNIALLQEGDMLYFPQLKAPYRVGWLSILIQDSEVDLMDDILIQTTLQSEKQEKPYAFEANGTHFQIQNIAVEDLLKILTQSRPGKLEVVGKKLPRLDVFFHSPQPNLPKALVYERILDVLKRQYAISIKTKYQTQTGWFLSGGDPEKLKHFTEEQVRPNLEFFNEEIQREGKESVGPMNFKWFADRYFELEYDMQVTDLTKLSGRYILPLHTKSLKSLQKQLKKDYDLVLKKQQRTIPMTVVRVE